MSNLEFPADSRGRSAPRSTGQTHRREPALVIQILSVLGFGVFSIVAVSLAFAAFWVAGLLVAMTIAWTWAGSRMFGARHSERQTRIRQSFSDVAPSVMERRSSGNARFDAYREETLEQLEHESRDFDKFLSRLREARDAKEFDQFLDDRVHDAQLARSSGSEPYADHATKPAQT